MRAHEHVGVSIPAAALILFLFRSPLATLLFLAGGILVDLDHLLDFFVIFRQRGGLRDFLVWFEKDYWERTTIFLHSWEILVPLLLLALTLRRPLFLAFTLGWGMHVLLDQYWNRQDGVLHPLFYSLFFRAVHGFRKQGVTTRQGKTAP